ncbi:hypothetical protein L1049_027408 [Liquidambar formosana]|uniref:Disease resistance R13L4/SHOC-2-like LRR domain-containing protein n=1 Tax=Liquidambar formosana TaxID=63359 RepID=A0AAP0RH76_LIQFO
MTQWGERPQAPDDLFEGMEELRVLNLWRVVFLPSPPRSLSLLTKLQTLYLCDCHLKNVSAIGELETLVILGFGHSYLEELPREIGNLTHLRMLDLTQCKLQRISPGVISSLKRLEELYVISSFNSLQWVVEEGGKGENMVNLTELLSLSNLTHLETFLPYAKFPRGINHFKNLERFWILIKDGEKRNWSPKEGYRNKLELHLDTEIPIDGWINVLLKKTETLRLTWKGAKNVLNDLITPESLVKLKSLCLYDCEGLEYLIDAVDFIPDNIFPNLESLKIDCVDNLKMICHGELPARSFSELRRLDLRNLRELMHLWKDPTEVVSLRNLRHVQKLEVNQEIEQEEHLVKAWEVEQEIEQEEHLDKELEVNQEIGYEEHLDDNDDDHEN